MKIHFLVDGLKWKALFSEYRHRTGRVGGHIIRFISLGCDCLIGLSPQWRLSCQWENNDNKIKFSTY